MITRVVTGIWGGKRAGSFAGRSSSINGSANITLGSIQGPTNLLLYSEQQDNGVYEGSYTVTPNVATAPNGTLTADKLYRPTSPDYWLQIGETGQPVTGKTFTYSVWLWTDVGQSTAVIMYIYPSLVDVHSDAITITTTPTRYSFTATAALTELGTIVAVRVDPAVASYVYSWGWQLQVGSAATSYIPTTSAAVTGPIGVGDLPIASTASVTLGALTLLAYETEFVPVAESNQIRNFDYDDYAWARIHRKKETEEVIEMVARRQSEHLLTDEQKIYDELTRELKLKGLELKAIHLEALNFRREQLINEEIGKLSRKRIQDEYDDILMLIAMSN